MADYVLFSGCAHDKNGAAPRQATIALAKQLGIAMWEAPDTGCCGARADRRVSVDARRKTLAPVFDAARQGLDVVCLSPSCRRVVGADAPVSNGPSSRPLHVRDVTELLDAYSLSRLSDAALRGLTGLRVAAHATCHVGHIVMPIPKIGGEASANPLNRLTALLSGARALSQRPRRAGGPAGASPAEGAAGMALSGILRAIGAANIGDVSIVGRCGEIELPLGGRRPFSGKATPAPCLLAAAHAEADVVVTPCFLCFIGLNNQQRSLPRGHDARAIPVLHLSQLVGVACEASPRALALDQLAASPRRALNPFVV